MNHTLIHFRHCRSDFFDNGVELVHLFKFSAEYLAALDVIRIFLSKITKPFLRSYCGVFNSAWENS